ncbi:MAG: TrkA family potassium uptake protein [Actinobacteria bacterium]|nr:TrkA family potassium uptake protein [Actinomycetota bacterium]
MRVTIAGAGNVGRSIARELIANGHSVLLIDRAPTAIKPASVPEAEWLLADACELHSLAEARLDTSDVSIAATGDDKVNLVHSLLAKTEFGVPRTVGRVNHPGNEWLFDDMWGVDVAVSTPRLMCALVEEAVTVGDLVRLMTFQKGRTNLVEMTLPESSPTVGRRIGEINWPGETVLTAIIRDGRGMAPDRDGALEAGDELMFLIDPDHETELSRFLSPRSHIGPPPQEFDLRAAPVEGPTAPVRRSVTVPTGPVAPAPLKVLDEDTPRTGENVPPAAQPAAGEEPDLPLDE